MHILILVLLICSSAFGQLYPPTIRGGGSVGVTGGAFNVVVTAETTLTVPQTGARTALLAGAAYTAGVTGCIPYQATSTYGALQCDSNWLRTNGNVTIRDATAPVVTVRNTGANQGAFFEYSNSVGRQWLMGPGLALSSHTGFAFAEYTDGSFQSVFLYMKKGGTTCLGRANVECTTGTVTIKDNGASGATRVAVQLGSADSTTTATITNAGTTRSAGNQSADGTVGITGTTCVAASMQVKNGFVVAGCT